MAALDIQGFITPEQQFTGLTKLGDTLAAQQAARQKEKAAQDANKKLLNKVVEDINPKDFISATIIDGKTSQDIYSLKTEAQNLIKQNKDLDQNDLNALLLPKISKLAKRVQNAKEVDRQLKKGAEEMKGVAGFDSGKYFEESKKYFLNPDGSVREDIENIDPTKDYYQEIMNNGNVWTAQAIHGDLEKLPVSTTTNKYTISDGKRKKITDLETTYNPIMYQPKMKNGVFQNDFQASTDYVKKNGQLVLDKNNNPIEVLGQPAYDYFMSNPKTKGYINQRKRQIALENNLSINDAQLENLIRHELWNEISNSPQRKTSYKEAKGDITYINTGGGKGAGGGEEVRDIHTPAANLYEEGQAKKDKAIDLIKQGKSDEEIVKMTGLSKGAILATRQGRGKYRMPLNTKELDAEFVNRIIDNLPKKSKTAQGKTEIVPYTNADVGVQQNDNGDWEVYDKEGKNLIATISPETLGWKIQPGAKEKRTLAQEEKQRTRSKASKGTTSQTKSKKDDPLGIFP